MRARAPQADIEGYAVQPMVVRKQAQELILGMSRDPIFGPVILFGAGGVAVEVMDDTAIALPPLDDVLAGDLIERTRIGRLLAGFRDRKPADRAAIAAALNGLSQMIVDFPCIVAMDINPLLADAEGVDRARRAHRDRPGGRRGARTEPGARDPALSGRMGSSRSAVDGTDYHIRPIKPVDIALYPDFLAKVSPEDVRLRFLAPRKDFPDEMLKRLTQLDYDRDMAFVALEAATGALAGIGRLSSDPDRAVAEYALLVRTDLQGHGLGWALLRQIVDFARAEGIGRIEGFVLAENDRMLTMCREFGFGITFDPDEPGLAVARASSTWGEGSSPCAAWRCNAWRCHWVLARCEGGGQFLRTKHSRRPGPGRVPISGSTGMRSLPVRACWCCSTSARNVFASAASLQLCPRHRYGHATQNRSLRPEDWSIGQREWAEDGLVVGLRPPSPGWQQPPRALPTMSSSPAPRPR